MDKIKPRFILFDIGGVLIELNDPVGTFDLNFDKPEFYRRWLLSDSVRAFERGKMGAREFAGEIIEEFELPYGPVEFLERFRAWPGDPFSHAIDIVRRIDSRYPCGLMSNTNTLHWPSMRIEKAFDGRFERVFLSHETGLLKPDKEAFRHVIDSLETAPPEILFFDDNSLNVAGASSLGINAVLCSNEANLLHALAEVELLS